VKDNKVPTLSIVLDMPEKKPTDKDELDTVFGRTPNASRHKYYLQSIDSSQRIEVKDFPFSIGRALTSNLVIMDKNVSRNHAAIIMDDGHITIENKGSLNGVRVNNRKVERVVLLNGDEIKIAGARYKLQVERIETPVPAAALDDSQPIRDAYNTKAASNDDLLEGEQDQPEENLGVQQQAGKLAGKVGNKTLFALISITVIVAIATVVTLFQSTPDLSVAIKDVKEKETVIASKIDTDIAASRTEYEYKGTIGNTQSRPQQQQPTDDVDNITNDYPSQASTHSGVAHRTEPRTVETSPAIQEPKPATVTTLPVDNVDHQVGESSQVTPQAPVDDPYVEITTTQEPENITPPPVVAKRDIEVSTPTPVVEPVTPKPVKPIAVKPAPVKYTRYSARTSQIKLDNARGLYLGGDYYSSIRELKSIYNSSRHRQEYRSKARTMRDQFSNLYALYSQGKSEYARHTKPKAFKTWASYLKKERALLQGRTSQYTRNVKKTVALEYEEKGRQAYMRDDWRSAFRYWKSSLKMRPNPSIDNVMKQMETEIASLYASGSKLEKTNKPEAIKYWTKVVNKAPDNHEYHIKAKAKLRWLTNASH